MNFLERAIGFFSPEWAAHRAYYRNVQAHYEAANPSRHRKSLPLDHRNANQETQWAAKTLAEKARYFDANSDYVTGGLDVLEASIVGRGILSEPLIRRKDGTPYTELNQRIKQLHLEWLKKPSLDGIDAGGKIQRLACRSWLRDGECFIRFHEGYSYRHHTSIPLSIELIEREQLDIQFNSKNIIQGIEKDNQGIPVNYWFFKQTPNSILQNTHERVGVPAVDVLHLKHKKRIGQVRGISALHAVLDRVQDINEYDEFERTAAKQGASIGLKIERSADYVPTLDQKTGTPIETRERIERFFPGMVLDGLDIGETAEMLNPNSRPNPQLEPFRDGQLRAVAAGLGLSPSSLMRKYTGSYSAERQALTESQRLIEPKGDDIIADFIQPLYERFLLTVVLYGLLKLPADIDPLSLFNAAHRLPKMPSIDPKKEVESMERMVQGGFDSRANQIRGTGRNPDDVMQEIVMDNEKERNQGVRFTTSADGNPQMTQDVTNEPQKK